MHFPMQPYNRWYLSFIALLAMIFALFVGTLVATDPRQKLVLVSAEFAEGTSGRVINGIVENRTDRVFSRVTARFELLSDDGRLLGTALARADTLRGRETWSFMAPVKAPGAVRLRGIVQSPDNRRPAWLGGCTTMGC